MLDFSKFYPMVYQVYPTDDYKLYLYFNDGSVRLFDVKPLIKENTVFEPLKDIKIFKETATVLNGTAAWDLNRDRDEFNCIDLDPIILFESPEVSDPLEEN